jgi:small subunit ribosomal protein S18
MARKRKKDEPIKRDCQFCKTGKEPYWRDYQVLKNFLSPRMRILSREKTGVCSKHQRRLAKAVKHARHLGLLPFITRVG